LTDVQDEIGPGGRRISWVGEWSDEEKARARALGDAAEERAMSVQEARSIVWTALVSLGTLRVDDPTWPSAEREGDEAVDALIGAVRAEERARGVSWLADMHEGEDCRFEGGDGCMACLGQDALQTPKGVSA
jgi:hypothetical protein